MKLLIGIVSALLQYQLFAAHPILRLYPSLVDGAAGPGAFAGVLLLTNIAIAARHPQTSATTALMLYIAEAALASPLVHAIAPLPQLPPPDLWLGAAAVLVTVASAAGGAHGIYLSATAAPAALAAALIKETPTAGEHVGIALVIAGVLLVAIAAGWPRKRSKKAL